jgi:hypothetical protein
MPQAAPLAKTNDLFDELRRIIVSENQINEFELRRLILINKRINLQRLMQVPVGSSKLDLPP